MINVDFIIAKNTSPDAFLRENATVIELAKRLISRIQYMAFSAFPEVKTIGLQNNAIMKINNFDFESNSKLIALVLSKNKINQIEKQAFAATKDLKNLYLSYNELEFLDPELFSENTELRILQLNNNRFSDINPMVLVKLQKLERLYLHNNQFRELPFDRKKALKSLNTVTLFNNYLEIMPNYNIKDALPSLRTINLNGNYFNCSYLPKIMEDFEKADIIVLPRNVYRPSTNVEWQGVQCLSDDQYMIKSVEAEIRYHELIMQNLYGFIRSLEADISKVRCENKKISEYLMTLSDKGVMDMDDADDAKVEQLKISG